jgi:hypothetical protein
VARKNGKLALNDRTGIGDGEYQLGRKRHVLNRKRQKRWNSAPTIRSAWLVSAMRRIELSPTCDIVDAANDVLSGSDIRSDVNQVDPAPICSWRACVRS